MGHWDKLYTTGHTQEPSPFATYVAESLPARAAVLDLGCGNGRDTNYFARLGHTAVGLDVSPAAVKSAHAARDASGVPAERCSFFRADVTDSAEIAKGLRLLPAGLPRVIYARFLLHSLPPHQARNLMMAVGERLQGFECAFLEFRTDEDAALPKVFDHPRHFLALTHFNEMAVDARLQAEILAHGRGLADFGSEKPVVARIRVTADAPVAVNGQSSPDLLAGTPQ